MSTTVRGTAAALALATTALVPAAAAQDAVRSQQATYRTTVVADKLVHPWALDFLPDGALLVTEKPGRLRLVDRDGRVSDPIAGVPKVDARRQGGLLDVTLHPNFAENRFVYLSFAEPGEGGATSTAVARGRLSEDRRSLEGVEVVYSQKPKVDSTMHYGSRIVFDGRGHMFVGLGERFADRFRDQAQDLDSDLGKVVRLTEDGGVPDDNPFAKRPGAHPEIWTYGHRNIQAAAMNPSTGDLWVVEHGPRGGDEINVAKPGLNFGWPRVSHGVNYDGTPVGTGKAEGPGFTPPIKQWTPVIAASGMLFYSGDAFPDWKGNLFVGGLATKVLVRLQLDGNRVTGEERLLKEFGERIRDVAQGPDGALWVVTDEDNGKLVRIAPADRDPGATGAGRPGAAKP